MEHQLAGKWACTKAARSAGTLGAGSAALKAEMKVAQMAAKSDGYLAESRVEQMVFHLAVKLAALKASLLVDYWVVQKVGWWGVLLAKRLVPPIPVVICDVRAGKIRSSHKITIILYLCYERPKDGHLQDGEEYSHCSAQTAIDTLY